MKAIICLWGFESVGKTTSIGRIWKLLKDEYAGSEETILHSQADDFCSVLNCCGNKIGVCSQGDPYSKQEEWLTELEKEDCEMIVCASRSKGNTVLAVERLAQSTSSKLIWISGFSSDSEEMHFLLNTHTAESIVSLIHKLLND